MGGGKVASDQEQLNGTMDADPSFYPSPRLAAKAPAETLAYVAAFAPKRDVPDAIAVVDVDPGLADLFEDRRRRRHAAHSATSCTITAGTRAAPASAPTRRIRTSSAAISWCRACALRASTSSTPSPTRRSPAIVRVIEPEEVIEATGYSRPHTVHCGPDGIYVSALGDAKGDGARRRLPHGPRDLRRARPLGGRPRPAAVSPTTPGGISATTPW